MVRRIITSLLIVAVAMVVIWALGQAAGFRFDLGWSLAWSLGLTLVINLFIGIFTSGRRRDQRRIRH